MLLRWLVSPGAEQEQQHGPACSMGRVQLPQDCGRASEGEEKQDSRFPCELRGCTDALADGPGERRPTAEAGRQKRSQIWDGTPNVQGDSFPGPDAGSVLSRAMPETGERNMNLCYHHL